MKPNSKRTRADISSSPDSGAPSKKHTMQTNLAAPLSANLCKSATADEAQLNQVIVAPADKMQVSNSQALPKTCLPQDFVPPKRQSLWKDYKKDGKYFVREGYLAETFMKLNEELKCWSCIKCNYKFSMNGGTGKENEPPSEYHVFVHLSGEEHLKMVPKSNPLARWFKPKPQVAESVGTLPTVVESVQIPSIEEEGVEAADSTDSTASVVPLGNLNINTQLSNRNNLSLDAIIESNKNDLGPISYLLNQTPTTTGITAEVALPRFPCAGYSPALSNFYLSFPFALLNNVEDIVLGNRALHSSKCRQFVAESGQLCSECSCISEHPLLRGIESRHQGDYVRDYRNLNDSYLSLHWWGIRRDQWKRRAEQAELNAFNLSKKVYSMSRKLMDHKRLVTLLKENDVNRIHQLLDVMIKNGSSISAICNKVEEAIQGKYHAKGYSERDLDISLTVIRLGGRRLLDILHKSMGIPSFTTFYKSHLDNQPRLVCSTEESTFQEDATYNLQQQFTNLQPGTEMGVQLLFDRRYPVNIGSDEIAIRAEVCYQAVNNKLIGIGYENMQGNSSFFSKFEDALRLRNAIDNGDITVAKEALVLGVKLIGKVTHGSYPVLIIPSDKSATTEQIQLAYNAVLYAWKALKLDILVGPVFQVSSDGAATRRMQFLQYFRCHEISEEIQDFGESLDSGFHLLDTRCGASGICSTFDLKHIWKRFASRLRTENIGTLISDHAILRSDFLSVLSCIADRSHVNALLNAIDKQNVPKTVELFKLILQFGNSNMKELVDTGKVPESRKIFMLARQNDFKVLGELLQSLLDPILSTSATSFGISLHDILTGLSKSAHLLLVLHRTHRTAFFPNQTYHDAQAAIQEIFLFVLKCQRDPTLDDLPIFIGHFGTDFLEQLFGIVRSMNHSRGVNARELCERLSQSAQLKHVLEKYPDWDRGPRRLRASNDHVNLHSWQGELKANSTNLRGAWAQGRRAAIQLLRLLPNFENISDAYFTELSTHFPKITMLKPFGEDIGVAPGRNIDEATFEEESASEEGESNETESVFLAALDSADSIDEIDSPSNSVAIEGKMVHKVSAIKQIFDLSLNSEAYSQSDRLLRVRGFGGNVVDEETVDPIFFVGDPCLAAFFTSSDDTLAVFICSIKSIELNGSRKSDVSFSDVNSPQCYLYVEPALTTVHETSIVWSKSIYISKKLKIAGQMIAPVNPTLDNEIRYALELSVLEPLANSVFVKVKDRLNSVRSLSLEAQHVNLKLPDYRRNVEKKFLFSCQSQNLKCDCEFKNRRFKDNELRCHVGRHILRRETAVDVLDHPLCTFCGAKQDGERCWAQLVVENPRNARTRIVKIRSNCPKFYAKITYKSANKHSRSKACTNVPVQCEACCATGDVFVGKYSLAAHYRAHHSDDAITEPFVAAMKYIVEAVNNEKVDEDSFQGDFLNKLDAVSSINPRSQAVEVLKAIGQECFLVART